MLQLTTFSVSCVIYVHEGLYNSVCVETGNKGLANVRKRGEATANVGTMNA